MKEQVLRRELAVLILASVLLAIATFALLPVDQAVSESMRRWTNPALTSTLRAVSFFGGAAIEAILVGLAVLFFAWQRRWLEAGFVLASTASAGTLGAIIRLLVRRDRPLNGPDLGVLLSLIGRYSFPSGHALFYTAFFGAMAYLLWARFSGRARWVGIVLCLALIVMVGPSRVYLGAHWPSDVVAGYLVGALCVSSLIMLYQWRRGW